MTASRPWRRWIKESGTGWPFYVWAGLLLAFNSLVVYLSRGVADEIYLVYFPVILFAAATLEPSADIMLSERELVGVAFSAIRLHLAPGLRDLPRQHKHLKPPAFPGGTRARLHRQRVTPLVPLDKTPRW